MDKPKITRGPRGPYKKKGENKNPVEEKDTKIMPNYEELWEYIRASLKQHREHMAELFQKSQEPKEALALASIIDTPIPNDLKKTLFDLLVIARAVYEDMVMHNINTNSRKMLGRFLYSQGYDQVIAEIEKKHFKPIIKS